MNNYLRNLIVITVLLVLCFGSTVMAEEKVGGILMQADHEWFKTIEMGMRAAAEDNGVKLVVGNSNLKLDKEASLVDTFIAQQVDAICLSPLNSQASIPAARRVVNNDIDLIIYNTSVNYDGMDCYVGIHNYDLGAKTANYLKSWIEKNNVKTPVKIGMIEIPMYEVGQQRRNGFFENIQGDDRFEVVSEQAGEVAEDAANVAESMLQAHPDIDVLWAANEGGTVGAMVGVKNSGKDVKVFGTDMSLQLARTLLSEDNIVEAVISQQPYVMGYKAVESSVKKIRGEEVPEEIIVNLKLYTRENSKEVEKYLKKYKELSK